MNATEIYRHEISRDALRSIPAGERSFLFGACHLANELNILHKLCLWSTRKGLEEADATKEAQIAQALFLLRLLSGKLSEGYLLFRKSYWGAGVSQTYSELLDSRATTALQEIGRYFSRANPLRSVRNDFAFHYSPAASNEALESLPAEEALTFYSAASAANCLYYFSEVLAGTAMLGDDKQSSLKKLLDDLVRLSKCFFDFIGGFLGAFFERFPAVLGSEPARRLDLDLLPEFSEVVIPFFTTEPD